MKASPHQWYSPLLKEAQANLILCYHVRTEIKAIIERRKYLEGSEFVGALVLDLLAANACCLKTPQPEAWCCNIPNRLRIQCHVPEDELG